MAVKNKYFMKKYCTLSFVLLLTILLSGCAEIVPVKECLPGDPYGFWGGLWHGMVAPFSFIASLFIDGITMYSVNNTGGWYDFGFVLGAGILFGSSSRSKK